MKKLLVMTCLVTINAMASPASHDLTNCCKKAYKTIKDKLDTKQITIKEAQELWKKHQNQTK